MSVAQEKRFASLDAASGATSRGLFAAFGSRPAARYALRALSLVLFIALWHVASTWRLKLGVVVFTNVPTPAEALDAAIALARSSKLAAHLTASVTRVLAGFAIAAAIGVGAGLAVARSKVAEDLIMPTLELLRPIPAVAWIPSPY
jgi:NitT/TauT family transport system permease protein